MKERLEQTTTMQEAAMIAAEADKVELAAASAAAVSTAAEAMVPDSDESPLLSSREIGTEEGGWGSDGNSLTLQAVGAGGCEGSGGSGGRAGSGEEWVFQPANSHFKQPNRKFDPDAFRDTNTVDIVHGETFIDRYARPKADLHNTAHVCRKLYMHMCIHVCECACVCVCVHSFSLSLSSLSIISIINNTFTITNVPISL